MRTIKAWHFLPSDGCLRYGTREKVEVGKTIRVDGRIALCDNGLHGSRSIRDALTYAPGAIVCEVAIWDDVVEGTDKLAGRNRKVLRMADATNTLLEFACRCAEHALKRYWTMDDNRPYEAIQAVRKHILGEKVDLRAAYAAAYAARAAADAAYAARAAADAADAAYAAADAAQNRLLRVMVSDLLDAQ